MYKVFKWIYRLGVKHERRRIQGLIAVHRNFKPEKPNIGKPESRHEADQLESYERALGIWYGVDEELQKLVDPYYPTRVNIEAPKISLLDQD